MCQILLGTLFLFPSYLLLLPSFYFKYDEAQIHAFMKVRAAACSKAQTFDSPPWGSLPLQRRVQVAEEIRRIHSSGAETWDSPQWGGKGHSS